MADLISNRHPIPYTISCIENETINAGDLDSLKM